MALARGTGILLYPIRQCKGSNGRPIADFQTLDDQPVNLLFMIAAAYNQHSYYLKTISYFSGKLKQPDLRESMLSAQTEMDIYNLLVRS